MIEMCAITFLVLMVISWIFYMVVMLDIIHHPYLDDTGTIRKLFIMIVLSTPFIAPYVIQSLEKAIKEMDNGV